MSKNRKARFEKQEVKTPEGQERMDGAKTIKFEIGIEYLGLEVGSRGPDVLAGFSFKAKGLPTFEYMIAVPSPVNAFLIGLGVDFLKGFDK